VGKRYKGGLVGRWGYGGKSKGLGVKRVNGGGDENENGKR